MASFGSLSIGVSGLYASQKGLQTISHNIANADNPEYSRQRVDFNESHMRKVGQHKVGTGTDVATIKQIRDEFLDNKLRGQVSDYGYWGERNSIYSQIESIINETGEIGDKVTGGLAKTMDDFWKSFEELAKDPSNVTVRGVVKQRAEGLVTTVRHIYDQLDTLQSNINVRVQDVVDETNNIAKQIADLNKEIVAKEAAGMTANDYKDKRNGLIDRLSQIADISVNEDSKGYVNIAISGTHIVSQGSTKKLEYRGNSEGPLVEVYWEGEDTKINKSLKSGELLAILEARGTGTGNTVDEKGFTNLIPAMKEKLDNLIGTIAVAINEQQANGITLDGKDGQAMFVTEDGNPNTKITASNIKLNIKSLNDIAASSKDSAGVGNGKNAEEILKLRNKHFYDKEPVDGVDLDNPKGKLNIDDFYKDVMADLGIAGQDSSNRMEVHGRIIIELDNKKQSISGVSLDEELSDMLKFQHAYSASTRFINAIDEMIDVIVNRMAI